MLRGHHPDWNTLSLEWRTDRIEKGEVIKPYMGPREKGVVFISFENQWARLLGIRNLEEFAQRYTIVLAPTWSPPHALENTLFPAKYPGSQIFTLISNRRDVGIFPRLSPKFVVVPLYASNWVAPGIFQFVPYERKDIDIVMLAGFGRYKRHFALFRALSEIEDRFRVVLVGTPSEGRNAGHVMAEARLYGVQDQIEIRESVPNEVVIDTLARAKISLILSRREGSCVAVTESLFANTPVGMMEDASVGSLDFINDQTGRRLRHKNLGAQLRRFVAEAAQYSPREWAVDQQISCHGSCAVLNQQLREAALASGQAWTRDIATFHWHPDPVVLEPRAEWIWLKPAVEEIYARYGVLIGPSSRSGMVARPEDRIAS